MKVDKDRKQIILTDFIRLKDLKQILKQSNIKNWKKYTLVFTSNAPLPTYNVNQTATPKYCTITNTNDII